MFLQGASKGQRRAACELECGGDRLRWGKALHGVFRYAGTGTWFRLAEGEIQEDSSDGSRLYKQSGDGEGEEVVPELYPSRPG